MIVDYDKIVSDLRKPGFTIVTGLLSIGAFLTISGGPIMPSGTKAGVALLVTTLFFVDPYYVVQQCGTGLRCATEPYWTPGNANRTRQLGRFCPEVGKGVLRDASR